MSKNEFFFRSNDNVTNIHIVRWMPKGDVLGIVQINHGITEHIGRYEELAKFLNSKGILVVGMDLLGHGMSTNNGDKKMYFGPAGSYKKVLADIEYILKHTKESYPDVPYVMLGLSLGAFLTSSFLIDYPGAVDGAILIGYGYISNLSYKLAMMAVNSEAKKYGEDKSTDKINYLSFGSYNDKYKPNRTNFDWLCKNEKSLDLYISDSLRGENITVGLFREMLNAMIYSCTSSNIKKMDKTKPIYLLSGDDDYVGNRGKGVKKSLSLFKSCGVTDVGLKLYHNYRHDILHEEGNEQVFNDIYNWIVNKKLVNGETKK